MPPRKRSIESSGSWRLQRPETTEPATSNASRDGGLGLGGWKCTLVELPRDMDCVVCEVGE